MTKEFTKEEIILNKKEAIRSLNQLLESYINDSTETAEKHLKKANLISKWLKQYKNLLSFEEVFNPTRNISYKRGDVVKVNFGFNIGSEYGGVHYAVVLDKENAHHSPVVTVIPLTSLKEDKAIHENSVELGDDIYRSLSTKLVDKITKLEGKQAQINSEIDKIKGLLDIAEKTMNELEQVTEPTAEDENAYKENLKRIDEICRLQEELKKNIEQNQARIIEFKKIQNEVSRLKKGSVALVNQVTTISKMRIVDPQKTNDALSGISLPGEAMEKINVKLKELFVG